MSTWRDIVRKYSDPAAWLTAEGRVFYASDAAAGDKVTAVTSFATTTPTFQLAVPTDTTAIPLMVRLFQAGTVAGGAVDVIIEIDNALRFGSGGTAETVLGARTTGAQTNLSTLRSNPTATDAYGVRLAGYTLGQDVSPAEGAVNEIIWTPTAGLDLLVGPASLNVYTYAAVTAPTWFWTIKWAEFPSNWLT
jgi:hypothetical protein